MKYVGSSSANITYFPNSAPEARIDVSSDGRAVWLILDFGYGTGSFKACFMLQDGDDTDKAIENIVTSLREVKIEEPVR